MNSKSGKGGEKVKKKIILFASLGLLILLAMAAPAFALPTPTPGHFTQVVLALTTSQGTVTTVGTWEYWYHTTGIRDLIGAPWGNSISSTYIGNLQLNTASGMGACQIFGTDTYAAGVVDNEACCTYNGYGAYVYTGPTIAYTLGPMTGTVTHGATYAGILSQGKLIGVGVSGSFRGLAISETLTGLVILAGPNADVVLMVANGVVW